MTLLRSQGVGSMRTFVCRRCESVSTRTRFPSPVLLCESAATPALHSMYRSPSAAGGLPVGAAAVFPGLFCLLRFGLFSSSPPSSPRLALAASKRCFASTPPSLRDNKYRRTPPRLVTRMPQSMIEDPLDFTALSIRSVVRNTGPIPLSKLTPLLADEFLETIGNTGMSLAKFIEQRPNYLSVVHLPGHVVITMPFHLSKHFDGDEKQKLGIWVLALLSATHFLPGQPQVAALGLSSPQPTVEELSNALRLWTIVSPTRLEIFLRSEPKLFAVHAGTRRVRCLVVNAITPNETAMRSAAGRLEPLLKAIKPYESSKFALWLRTVVPSQFHVPVSYVIKQARELNALETAFGTTSPTLEQIKGQFQQLPSGFADIRAFGDALNTVFVRVIDPEPLLLEAGVPNYGGINAPPELSAADHNPTQLAQELTAALEQYASQSELTRARMVKGLEMSRLRDYVPASLMRKLEQFFGFSEKDDPRVCILLLDRLRHLWEVQLNAGTARLWAYLPESEMPSSLTLQTSPSPRVLLHCQRLLVECGAQPLMDLYNVLPSDLKSAFMNLYSPPYEKPTEGAISAVVAHDASAASSLLTPLVSSPPSPPSETCITGALQIFLRAHSLFFFMKDDLVHASRSIQPVHNERVSPIMQKERAAGLHRQGMPTAGKNGKRESAKHRELPLTDFEVAQVVYDTLPPDSWILVDSLRRYLCMPKPDFFMKKSRGLPVQTFRREFFERHHRFFDLHELFAFDKLVVSRAAMEVKETHLVAPRIHTIYHLIKLMALLSVDSISDASLTRRIPLKGRIILKSIGSVTDLAQQLPMWFVVRRDEVNCGASLIRYIGPLANPPRSAYALKPHPSGVLTRKVRNDPFADIPPDNVEGGSVDGWNDDWNEDEEDLFGNHSRWDDDER
ncbi:putative mitochondrial hypothetical protein [Leptomonas pyrrhocoris]|uniref:DUF7883 domain-containing protein n=1 Tax=Leptomonas pyrrhocoris TaxID=157538 RepID=A0A0M9G9T5_LEPPY|nr:putative mitochondrial hypothetical protein [Leptomonas pyrrhocoris]KPA85619.1 putative mitochondrial hypothetical protein [Leptomonas pyrrhocoris]|eukprot:XP_015664058.1 putative mitochondrial hypothetical protein [Leptomonas pyrrhocoris]